MDEATIDALYAASQAGVKIDLIVRGICCLVPGMRGLSENIRVRSLVGRFLEHARVYYFENGGRPLIYAGSADWMPRNFFRRVEVLFPILDPALQEWVAGELLPAELRDNVNAKELGANGAYQPVARGRGEPPFSVHRHFIAAARSRGSLTESGKPPRARRPSSRSAR